MFTSFCFTFCREFETNSRNSLAFLFLTLNSGLEFLLLKTALKNTPDEVTFNAVASDLRYIRSNSFTKGNLEENKWMQTKEANKKTAAPFYNFYTSFIHLVNCSTLIQFSIYTARETTLLKLKIYPNPNRQRN